MAHASFSMEACCCSDFDKVLEKNATGRPDCDSVAANAKLDASVSTVNCALGSTASIVALIISFLMFSKAVTHSELKGKVVCINGCILSEKFLINLE